MSDTFSIACTDCEEHLWIGQGNHIDAYENICFKLYSGEPKTMEALRGFLEKHYEHNLVFGDNCRSKISGYSEIKP